MTERSNWINPAPPISSIPHPKRFSFNPIAHVLPGHTMKPCPKCKRARIRRSHIEGPFLFSELPSNVQILEPRRSGKLLWKLLAYVSCTWWLFLPPKLTAGKVCYKVTPFAKCVNPKCLRERKGEERIDERVGVRTFSRYKRLEHDIRHRFGRGIDLVLAV